MLSVFVIVYTGLYWCLIIMNVKVYPLRKEDSGIGVVGLNSVVSDELGVDVGDIVRLRSNGEVSFGRVLDGYDEYEDEIDSMVRVDRRVVEELGISVRDTVAIEFADDVDSVGVLVFSVSTDRYTRRTLSDEYVSELVQQELEGFVVGEGDVVDLEIPVDLDRRAVRVRVESVDCDGKGVVDSSSDVRWGTEDELSDDVVVRDDTDRVVPDVSYADVGGLGEELDKVRELVELPLDSPSLFDDLGVDAPSGVLLYGPPGTGKTLIVKALANEVDAHFRYVSGSEVLSKYVGESERELREIFDEARENAPSVVFFDELDGIASSRSDASGDVTARLVSQLLTELDGLSDDDGVVVVGATNRPDDLDEALRRGGRFDREIEIGVPDVDGREEILHIQTRDMSLDSSVDIRRIAELTHGFVGADLQSLVLEASMNTIRRVDESDGDMVVVMEDFETAQSDITPSALREFFVEIPDVSWDDVGGLEDTKEKLQETVQWAHKYPDVFDVMDLPTSNGVLLYGPPGTGKTLLAKAISTESEVNFMSVNGPEMMNKYIGESEKAVRNIFEKARENSPSVVFFDEIDSIASSRNESDHELSQRVVSQLLTELDGLSDRDNVTVIAATNRPEYVDTALLRPGRLDTHIHVPAPSIEARKEILSVHLDDKPVSDDVDLEEIAIQTDGFVGADLESLTQEAAFVSTREYISTIESLDTDTSVSSLKNVLITQEHFNSALEKITPTMTADIEDQYDTIEQQFTETDVREKDEEYFVSSFQ